MNLQNRCRVLPIPGSFFVQLIIAKHKIDCKEYFVLSWYCVHYVGKLFRPNIANRNSRNDTLSVLVSPNRCKRVFLSPLCYGKRDNISWPGFFLLCFQKGIENYPGCLSVLLVEGVVEVQQFKFVCCDFHVNHLCPVKNLFFCTSLFRPGAVLYTPR